jgi:hypothetical protein
VATIHAFPSRCVETRIGIADMPPPDVATCGDLPDPWAEFMEHERRVLRGWCYFLFGVALCGAAFAVWMRYPSNRALLVSWETAALSLLGR